MLSRPWTEEERAVLIELANGGATASEAAKKLNRSKNSVIGFANRQFGGFTVVKPVKLRPLHVAPKKEKKGRKDGLSPTGRSTKTQPIEIIEALIQKPEPLPEVKPIRMLKAGRFQCRYIVSDKPKDHNPLMCGAPVQGLGSWCPTHRKMIFSPAPSRKA